MAIDDLYERDFYVWTQEQAAALRAAGKAGGRSNAVDWDLLAEEIEDLGNSQYFAVRSFTVRIIEHLLKLAWSQREEPKGGWRNEITHFRVEAEAQLTTAIRNRLTNEIDALHRAGLKLATANFKAYEPDAPRDETLRWTLAQVFGEADDPLEG
jgi:hypothetical protein